MTVSRCRRPLGVAGALLALLLSAAAPAVGVAAGPASSTANSTGGYCKDDTGVTVVVDLSVFDGDIIVRCVVGPLSSHYTGLLALQDAGFVPTGVSGTGLQFVCRINGLPSADEPLPVDGELDYRETCQHTPPASAYWAYSYAENGGEWEYGDVGASSHSPIEGGFEGWAFSLNNEGASQPAPAIAPERPAAEPPKPATPSEAPPPATPTPPPASPGGGSVPGHANGSPKPTHEPVPPPTEEVPSAAPSDEVPSAAPSKEPEAGGGRVRGGNVHKKATASKRTGPTDDQWTTTAPDLDVEVTGQLPAAAAADSAGTGSLTTTLIGVGAMVALGLGGGLTAWRRSRSR